MQIFDQDRELGDHQLEAGMADGGSAAAGNNAPASRRKGTRRHAGQLALAAASRITVGEPLPVQ